MNKKWSISLIIIVGIISFRLLSFGSAQAVNDAINFNVKYSESEEIDEYAEMRKRALMIDAAKSYFIATNEAALISCFSDFSKYCLIPTNSYFTELVSAKAAEGVWRNTNTLTRAEKFMLTGRYKRFGGFSPEWAAFVRKWRIIEKNNKLITAYRKDMLAEFKPIVLKTLKDRIGRTSVVSNFINVARLTSDEVIFLGLTNIVNSIP